MSNGCIIRSFGCVVVETFIVRTPLNAAACAGTSTTARSQHWDCAVLARGYLNGKISWNEHQNNQSPPSPSSKSSLHHSPFYLTIKSLTADYLLTKGLSLMRKMRIILLEPFFPFTRHSSISRNRVALSLMRGNHHYR